MPATDAAGTLSPRMPETRPRCGEGTWSGRMAACAAKVALKNTWQVHQPARTTGMLGAVATTSVPAVPPASPMSIQGRLMPMRAVVRSLRRPKSGLARMESSDPTPVTMARLRGAASMPTRSLTFNASDTRSGARNSREPPVYESA